MPPQNVVPGISIDPRHLRPRDRLLDFFRLRRLYEFKLYMIRPDPDLTDRLGCNDEVVEVKRHVFGRFPGIEFIYQELLALHERDFGGGLINALWESRLRLDLAYVDGHDVAQIELSGTLVAREPCSAPRITAQLERPAHQIRSGTSFVRQTQVRVNGRPLDEVLRSP